MQYIKVVFCLSLIYNLVCGQIRRWDNHRKLGESSSVGILISNSTMQENSPTDRPDFSASSTSESSHNQQKCPPEKSLHSKEDLLVMVNYFYDKFTKNESIKKSYVPQAQKIRDRHTNEIKQFLAWFQNRPDHMKHVLERLTLFRNTHLDQGVNQIANALKEYNKLNEGFIEKRIKTNNLLRKLKRYEIICEYNCEDEQEYAVFKRNVDNEYFCSSLEDLHKKISKCLNALMGRIQTVVSQRISFDDKNYEERIMKLKNNLKDRALQEFGRTMYDILNLHDKYHHLFENINSSNVHSDVLAVKNLTLQIDTKLLELNFRIEAYGKHCKSCNSEFLIRNTRRAESPESVVDEMIELKYNKSIEDFSTDLSEIFMGLEDLLNNTKEDVNLDNLKPIRDEVRKLTNDEYQALQVLQNTISKSSLTKLSDLVGQFNDLLNIIVQNIQKLTPSGK